jgi:hypothetical protein
MATRFPGIEAYRREATRLHPRPGSPDPRSSHIGGALLWPSGEPWPTCDVPHMVEVTTTDSQGRAVTSYKPQQHPAAALVPLAQLWAADIPTLPRHGGAALLQVLWCPHDHEFYDVGWVYGPIPRLIWRGEEAEHWPVIGPEQPVLGHDMPYLPTPCVLHPELITDYPWYEELSPSIQAELDTWDKEHPSVENYQYGLSVAPGWKVGGWPAWHLTDQAEVTCGQCTARMDLLLTIDSSEWEGPPETRWRPVEEPPLSLETVTQNEPTGVIVGRYGALRIFLCLRCVDAPVRLNIQ